VKISSNFNSKNADQTVDGQRIELFFDVIGSYRKPRSTVNRFTKPFELHPILTIFHRAFKRPPLKFCGCGVKFVGAGSGNRPEKMIGRTNKMKIQTCSYCGRKSTQPDKDSYSANWVTHHDWGREKSKHYRDCEWVLSQAHSSDSDGKLINIIPRGRWGR